MTLRSQHVAQELLAKVTKALGITAVDQWYYVSQHAATKVIGQHVLNRFGGTLASFLQYAYPHHKFDEEKLTSKSKLERDQKFVEVIIRKLFPNVAIQTKARKAVGIVNPETGEYLEIDFWIPSLKLGIEYQDKHHFGYQWYANNTLDEYKRRDAIKKVAMEKLGYTLITIGYWWDKTPESIAATIKKVRPDLLQELESSSAEPIPSDPPPGSIIDAPVIPGVAGLMSPCIPTSQFDPTGWYGGEKYDGIRGVFNPILNKMFSRSGGELSLVSSLLKDIPRMIVEGEITAGRGNYNRTAAVSYHSNFEKVNWPMFRYLLYDIPDAEVGNYTQRYSTIISTISDSLYIFSQSAFRVLLESKAHIKMLVDSIISDAGEGVIAQLDAQYEYGRAKSLAKIKVRRDADAQVLRINEGSCTCKLASGGTADIVFGNGFNPSNLKVGDIVSYYHNGYLLNSLVPRRGEIYKIRYDITWAEIVDDELQTASTRRSIKDAIGSSSLISHNSTVNKRGHWNPPQNVRAFFDGLARTSGFDPLVAENWYPVRAITVQNAGGRGLLHAYNYRLNKALSHAYPDLKFDERKFVSHSTKKEPGYWQKRSNVRAFFDDFARSSLFDPLVAENWYPVQFSSLRNAGGAGALWAHDFNVAKAVISSYPELHFEEQNFITHQLRVKNGFWDKQSHQREFFDAHAKKNGFDPLVAENWYSVRVKDLSYSGGATILSNYSLAEALTLAYPEVKFDSKSIGLNKTSGYWKKSENLRAFFDEFALSEEFDPLEAKNWYPVKLTRVQKAGGSGIFNYYNIKTALSKAYPELKFDEWKQAKNSIHHTSSC